MRTTRSATRKATAVEEGEEATSSASDNTLNTAFSSLRVKTPSSRSRSNIRPPLQRSPTHNKMMALFDVPEVKTPLSKQEAFDAAVQNGLSSVPTSPSSSSLQLPLHGRMRARSLMESPKISVPLYSIEASSDGKGSTKKRSMVLVDRKRFESLARRMSALEDQIAALPWG